MLGAILSDTLGLTGPTKTSYDKAAVDFLVPLAGPLETRDSKHGIMDWRVLYAETQVAKTKTILSADLFEVFDTDLKLYLTVKGKATLAISAVEVYGKDAYDTILAKPEEELYQGVFKVREFYQAQSDKKHPQGKGGTVHSYTCIIDTKNKVSTWLMVSEDAPIALNALNKQKMDVLSKSKECRLDSPEVSTRGGLTRVTSGSCVSRKSQMQPLLEAAVKSFYDGSDPVYLSV